MSTESTAPPPEPATRPGVVTRALSWSKVRAEGASRWATGARQDHASVDVGFRLADRDQRVAASVLAGGVAYRLFFWFLSFSLVANGALGFADGHRVEQMYEDLGMPTVVANTVRDVSQQTQHARWWVLLVGGWLLLWTGYTGAKALVLVHATVWRLDPPPIRKPWWASLGFTGSVLAFGASMALVQWVRSESHTYGVLATLLSGAVPLVFWLVVSDWLPHRGSGWRDLLPGAVLVAVGVQAMYLFTTWFLEPKLSTATATYGLLGVVSTALFWLYIFGRLIIGGATLNASLNDHRAELAGTVAHPGPDIDGLEPGSTQVRRGAGTQMPSARRTVVIHRPIDEVFAFFTDPANETKWRLQVKELSAPGPLAVGVTVHQEVTGPAGRGIPADFEVTGFEPPARYAFRVVAGPVRPVGEYRFSPGGDGSTTVSFSLTADLAGVKRMFMSRPVQRSMDGEMDALDRAKELIESS